MITFIKMSFLIFVQSESCLPGHMSSVLFSVLISGVRLCQVLLKLYGCLTSTDDGSKLFCRRKPRNAVTQYVPRTFTDKEKDGAVKSTAVQDFVRSVAPRLVSVSLQLNRYLGETGPI